MPPYPSFCGGSYTSQSPVTDQERTVNWYPEMSESEGATSRVSLYPTPGFSLFARLPTVPLRAMFAMGTGGTSISGRAFAISGNTIYEIFANASYTAYGTMAVNSNPATICTNGDGGSQLFITSGTNGYNYNLTTNVLTQVLTGTAVQGGELYGYFVAFDPALDRIRISALFDGTTWDPLQFLARSIGSDPWTAMLVTPYGQIFLPGSETGQYLYNAGTYPFPFAPDPSGLIEEGIASTFSLRQAGKSAVWLSTNKNGGYQVMHAQGFTPERISTHGLEDKIAGYSTVSDAIGETYEDRGHAFYLLTFPTAMATHCYDFNSGKWHERDTWIAENNAYDALRPTFHCFALWKHLMGDRTSGAIYDMSKDYGSDVDSRPLRRLRRAPAIQKGHRRIFFPEFEVLLQPGQGVQSGQGSNPLVMMRKSNDFGQSWSNERTVSAGAAGNFSARARFLQTGSGRGRVYEISVSDPTPWRVTDANLPGAYASTESA